MHEHVMRIIIVMYYYCCFYNWWLKIYKCIAENYWQLMDGGGNESVFFWGVTSPALLMFQWIAFYSCTHVQSLTGLSGL